MTSWNAAKYQLRKLDESPLAGMLVVRGYSVAFGSLAMRLAMSADYLQRAGHACR